MSISQAVLAAIATYGGWRLLRALFAPHPFDKLRGPPATSFALGNILDVFTSLEFNRSVSKQYGRVAKAYGILKEPILYVSDPKALTHIFLKEQQVVYEEDAAFLIGSAATFGKGLLSATGDQHKKQRKMLNPVFSVAHLKRMEVPTFISVTNDLCDVLLRKTAEGPQEIDLVPWLGRTAIEIMARSGLDRSLSPVHEGKEEHRYIVAMKLFIPTGRNLLFLREFILPFIRTYKIGTPAMHRFIGKMLPWKSLHKAMEITDVMHEVSQEIFNEKRKEMEAGSDNEGRKDILSILMQENEEAARSDKLSDEEVVAQISTLMFAAMDTTSNSLSRIFWLLSRHRDVQQRLREEIRKAEQSYDGELDYEKLFSLPYLDAVVRETLRLYAPAALVTRTALKDAILPFSKPIKNADGKEIQEVLVPKGSNIVVSIDGVNTDPELWGPDSLEFKPERWLSPLPTTVTDARVPGVYSHMMTFIGGGRACIGFKFSELELKVVLFSLVSKFEFAPGAREVSWIMDGITTPSVGNDPKPQMPVVVSRAA